MFDFYPLLIPIAPLLAALFTALPQRCIGDKNYAVGWWIIASGFIASLLVLWQVIQNPAPIQLPLFASPLGVLPPVALSIDRLSAVMMVVISGFGTLLYRYSTRYLQQDSGQGRYQTLLALAVSSLLFMVSSADLVTLFICWQLLSWFLCLLSHNFAHLPTAQSSFRTFVMLRAGDLAFLAGIVLAYHLYGTVQFPQLFELAAIDQTRFALLGTGLEITGATAVTLLIFIGAMSKSAQFPLHMWLPDSLYAPTPIHALLHAGIINAGGFLLTRLAPLVILSPTTLHVVLAIGFITAILGTSMMLVQNDIKKTLGYSTIGQMGYMIMECGLGAFSLAVFHLIAHGLFKADIFLNCGKGIHEARLSPAKPPTASTSPSGQGAGELITTLFLSFLVPFAIVVGVHYLLGISFLKHQGLLILLLFSWVTASQAMLTLFRLNKTLLTKIGMLVTIGLVATGYFFAAEQFTHFLHPTPGVAEAYLQAAALPYPLFIALSALLVVAISAGWLFSIGQQNNSGQASCCGEFKTKAYLFFINRLYMDGLALRILNTLKQIGRTVDQSLFMFISVAGLALVLAISNTTGLTVNPLKTILTVLPAALLVPLFPFHGMYVAALTRAPRVWGTVLSLLPVAGVYSITWLLPSIPKALLPAISILAATGALWGSVKALAQIRVERLLTYGGLALYSIFWWHVANVGLVTPPALLYAWTVTLVWCGLFFAWDRVRLRHGELDLNQIGGLFQPMPRFATCLGLLIMAALGLPPFGLFFGYLGLLLSPTTGMSFGLAIVIATWFIACWYLFKLMQRLLFGPHRTELRYDDIRPAEVIVFVLILLLLVIPVSIPQGWLGTATTTTVTWNTEAMP